MMDMKTCPHCSEELPQEAKFCPSCMEKLIEEKSIPAVRMQGRKKGLLKTAGLFGLLVAVALLVIILLDGNTSLDVNGDDDVTVAAWVMKLRPHGGIDSFRFCLESSIVGFGWGLQGNPATVKDYRTLRRQEGAYEGDTMLDMTLDNFENITQFGSRFTHLLWTVDPSGYYYIAEIIGAYQYSRDEAHETAGIVNFAEVIFYKIGTMDLVPQTVRDTFAESGVILFIYDQETTDLTKQLWQVAKAVQK